MTEMIRSAKNTTKKLLVEDSGIAMPISLLVFLFLTFVCMSVFALGEVVRVRTELQYKVDNAAYADALVQADSLSRIAVLNRALAWTYAQTNKRQMDYIVNRWLSESYDKFLVDADKAELAHVAGCALHTMSPLRKTTSDRHTTGFKTGDAIYYMVTNENKAKILADLNTQGKAGTLSTRLHGLFEPGAVKDGESNIYTLKNMLDQNFAYGYYEKLAADYELANKNMQTMQQQLHNIKTNMYLRIKQCVNELLPENNTLIYGGNSENTLSEFLVENQDETDFFERYKKQCHVDLTNTWTGIPWWSYENKKKCRAFVSGHLSLKWTVYGIKWLCNSGDHDPLIDSVEDTTVNAGTSPDGTINWGSNIQSVSLTPLQVNKDYFGKNGSIVVAAKTPIPDLFGNVFGKNKFLHFRVNGNLWAVAAARAGYRNGEKYENSKFLNEDEWNLFKDDWEPMFLPVGRCWKSWDGEKFTGDGADKVLKAVGLEFDEKVNWDMLH